MELKKITGDVITGGHKLVHSAVTKRFQPVITVTLPNKESIARSLNFDNKSTETQLVPDKVQSCKTSETTAKAISRSASPVLNSNVNDKPS